jgi:hypothetical protein
MMLYIDIATGKLIAKAGSVRDRIERAGRKVGVTV